MNGQEYLQSLRDGREVWLHGERVKDVTTHPAFRNAARSIARMYDSLHDPERRSILTTSTDTGSGGFTHKFFRSSRSAQELLEARDAIAEWARLSYGWMGRSPDYKAAFLGTLGSNPEFYAPYQENARRWYKRSQEEVLFFNHAIVNPPVDRHLPPDQVVDVFVHVEEETDKGLVVSGAKMVATGSALTHCNFVATNGVLPIQDKRFAIAFIAAMDNPGVKLISRPSYELNAALVGSPFDYPLSSRFDENDAVMIFDRALIPWENVLIYGDIDKANAFYGKSGFVHRFCFHGCTRLAVKMDFISGLLLKGTECTGVNAFSGVQAKVGEVHAWRSLFWGLTTAMAAHPTPGPSDSVLPNIDYAMAYRVLAQSGWPKIKDIAEDVLAGALIVQNSSPADFHNPELRPYLDRFFRGSHGIDSEHKLKLMKLAWDALGSEFGGRHELYERNYFGNSEKIRTDVLRQAEASGAAAAVRALVDQCLADYDLNGWTDPTWFNPDDVSVIQPRSRTAAD